MTLKNGARQFFKVHITGDVLGAPRLANVSAVETLTAITDCTIKCIPLSRLGSIFTEHPRVGMGLFLSANKERIALMDLLATVGRLSAIERLSRFLLDLHDRLLVAGQTEVSQLPMPMTQEEIADLLGLTPTDERSQHCAPQWFPPVNSEKRRHATWPARASVNCYPYPHHQGKCERA